MSKRILVLGAGVGGALAMKELHKHFHHKKDYSITVVDKENYSTFAPMLHEVATGSVYPSDVTHPIRQIVQSIETFHQAEVISIDVKKKQVVTSRDTLEYDYLVIALGARNNTYGLPGVEEHTLKLKSLNDAVNLRNYIIDRFEQAAQQPHNSQRAKSLHFVIVGGGYTGVETAGQMADLFRKEFRQLYSEIYPDEPKISLIQGGDRILPILSEVSSQKAAERCERLGINLILGSRVAEVKPKQVILANGDTIDTQNVLWASGIQAIGGDFFDEEMLERGRIKLEPTLQMQGHEEVFVIGDIGAVLSENGPHPQTGQTAYQQAPVAIQNLAQMTMGKELQHFHYKHQGDLVPIGDFWAIAEIGPFKFSGFLAWCIRRFVYLKGLFSFTDRVRVLFNWAIHLVSKRDTTRL